MQLSINWSARLEVKTETRSTGGTWANEEVWGKGRSILSYGDQREHFSWGQEMRERAIGGVGAEMMETLADHTKE